MQVPNSTDPTPGDGLQRKTLKMPGAVQILIIVLFLCVIGGGWYYVYKYTGGTEEVPTIDIVNPEDSTKPFEEKELYDEGRQLIQEGNFEAATEIFDDVARNTENTFEKGLAIQQAGMSRFRSADLETQKVGIVQIKKTILASDTAPRLKADGIYNLAVIVCGSGCNEQLFEEVFKDEPFSQYRSGDNIGRSVANLHEWGLSVYATYDSYVRLMSYYGDILLARGKEMSDMEIDYFSSLIDQFKVESDRLLALALTQDRVGERGYVAYYFWKGYSYGGLAYVDYETYGEEFENAYEKSIELGETVEAGSAASQITSFAYYQYAAFLHKIFAEERRQQIQGLLDKLEQNVRANGPQETNQFVLMVQNEAYNESVQHGFVGESIYELAKQYPSFKAFLKEYGIDVEEKPVTEGDTERAEIVEE